MRISTPWSSAHTSSEGGFGVLPIELVNKILDLAEWPLSLHALSLVSKALNLHVAPRLYSILPIAWAQADRSSALLQVLQADADKAGFVQTLILCRRVNYKDPSSRAGWTPRSVVFPLATSSLERLANLLADILPLLRGIRDVTFIEAHPRLLVSGRWAISYTVGERAKRAVGLGPLLRRSLDDFLTTQLTEGAIWNALDRAGSRIESLTCPLLTIMSPRQSLRYLRTLHINGCSGPSLTDGVMAWTRAFVDMSELRTLVITDCSDTEFVFSGLLTIRAPSLMTLILHHVVFRHIGLFRDLSDFLRDNSQTLETLCVNLPPLLSPGVYSRALAFLLDDDTSCRRLRRLRIFNPREWQCAQCSVRPDTTPHRCAGALPRGQEFMEAIMNFVVRRTGIVDVALTGLGCDAQTLSTVDRILERRDVDSERLLLLGADGVEIRRGWDDELLPSRGVVLDEWVWDVFLTDGTDVDCDRPRAVPPPRKLRRGGGT